MRTLTIHEYNEQRVEAIRKSPKPELTIIINKGKVQKTKNCVANCHYCELREEQQWSRLL